MTHDEIWDDAALMRSWDDAVREYEVSLFFRYSGLFWLSCWIFARHGMRLDLTTGRTWWEATAGMPFMR